MTVLLCPLCSQPRFNNLESLRVSLVNAATQSISCPICDDVLMGLDKLTIHLFAHSLNQNKETDQRPSLELKTTKSVEEPCLVTKSQLVEQSSPGEKVAEKSGFEENDKFFSEIGSSLVGEAAQVQDPETKDDTLCTVNMEDLGFLTSWESIVKPKQNQKEVDSQNIQENNNKQENNELSEYMSDLLNKKLPILNFSYEPDPAVEMKETVEKDSGYEKKPLKCGICCFFFPNQVILSLHEELVHSKVKASGKKGEIFDSCKDEQEEKETSSDLNREKYEYLPELLNNNQNLEDIPHKYEGQFTIGDGPETNALELNSEVPETTLPRYDCHLCSKSFKMKGSLLVHFRVAHFSLNSSDSLQILGDISSTEDRNHLCPICSKTFKKEQHLAQHIKTHEGKQWQCETCSKHFTTKYFLKKHQRLHTGEMPYSCLTCKKTFTFQQSYHKHLLYHSDEKPHQCTQCGRSFKELSTLHNHQRIHSGEKPFACETCGKCFRQRVSYIVHQRIHTGVLPYQCTACKKKFRYKVSQRSHKCTAQPPGIVIRQPDIVQKLLENKQILQQKPG